MAGVHGGCCGRVRRDRQRPLAGPPHGSLRRLSDQTTGADDGELHSRWARPACAARFAQPGTTRHNFLSPPAALLRATFRPPPATPSCLGCPLVACSRDHVCPRRRWLYGAHAGGAAAARPCVARRLVAASVSGKLLEAGKQHGPLSTRGGVPSLSGRPRRIGMQPARGALQLPAGPGGSDGGVGARGRAPELGRRRAVLRLCVSL